MGNFIKGVAQIACAIIVVKLAVQAVTEVDRRIEDRNQKLGKN